MNERCIAIAVLDQQDVGGPFKVMPIVDDDGNCMVYDSDDAASEALDGHLLGAFIHIVPLDLVESY